MDYYKRKEEINRCLKLYFPPELKVIIEEYNKERLPWNEEIKNGKRQVNYAYIRDEQRIYNNCSNYLLCTPILGVNFILFDYNNIQEGRCVDFCEIRNHRSKYKSYNFDSRTKEWRWYIHS